MVEEPVVGMLKDFGAFGMALAVVGGAAWAVWKKVVEPQQKDFKEANKQYIATLNGIIEKNDKLSEKHMEAEKEHINALRQLNGDIRAHNERTEKHDERMGREHDRISQEIKTK